MGSLLQDSRQDGKPTRGYATFGDTEQAALGTDGALHAPPPFGCFSRLLFSFVTPFMELGSTRQLNLDDLWGLAAENQARTAAGAFSAAYEANGKSLGRTLVRFYGGSFAVCGILLVFSAAFSLLAPLVLNHVIVAFEAPILDVNDLAVWLGVFFAARVIDSLLMAQMGYVISLLSLRMTVSIKALLFRKVLRRKSKSKASDQSVDIGNLFTSDTSTIATATHYIHNLWILPIQMAIVMGMLYWVLGIAAFAGVSVIVLSMVLSYFVSKLEVGYFADMMRRRDTRMKTIKEVFSAIQTIKFNAWEDSFSDKIAVLRGAELKVLRDFLFICAVEAFVVWATPLFVSTVSFAVYVLVLGHTLTPAKAFTAIALFNALRGPLQDFPNVIQVGLQAKVALDRVSEYLALDEYNPSNVETESEDHADDVAIDIQGGEFGWTDTAVVLRDVNLQVKKGDFVVIHGEVGAGKSSLCAAMLGEMEKRSGRVVVLGSVAYYSQQPWIQNMTVRDNILFGNEFDAAKYQKVLEACCLLADLKELPAGDATEIGHNGVNLSGGQKARVSLARACYSDADIFILDSPLAAVDAVVQSAIFRECICSLLENKTLLLVSHNPAIINSDAVNCSIHIENGTVSVTRRASSQQRHEIAADELFTPQTADTVEGEAMAERLPAVGKFVDEEKRQEGRVSREVFWIYFKSLGGFKLVAIVLFTQLLWQVFQIGSDLWMTYWTGSAASNDRAETERDMAIYAGLAGAGAVMVFVRSVTVVFVGMRGARHLFDAMTRSLLRVPMRFFDANPIGRIINRYGVDVMSIDVRLPIMFASFLSDVFVVVCQLATAVYMINVLGLLVVPLGWLYIRVANFYLNSSREISRLRQVVGSPVLNFVSQCEDGLTVIRAFGPEYGMRMLDEVYSRLDDANKVAFMSTVAEQWYVVRIMLIGCGMVIGIVSALVYLRALLSPGLVGLTFSYALSVDAGLSNIIRQWSYVEIVMVSPERVMEYASLEPEAASQLVVVDARSSWPERGAVHFDNVVFRYTEKGLAVLKSASFSINAKEKVGIVGRTGAGKSSLTMALFRINELSAGRILIDGVDIATLPLRTLRSQMSIIPQSPVLFKGSLRAYMDPFDVFSDQQIWEAFGKVGMKKQIAEMESQLLAELAENGENFSVGERQLLCMARALLTRSRIVVMDEATASIDHDTERKLQEMIALDFEDATVLTIAHRLATVLESDRVLVLKDGDVVEFDSPRTLVKDTEGTFYQFVKEGGYLGKFTSE